MSDETMYTQGMQPTYTVVDECTRWDTRGVPTEAEIGLTDLSDAVRLTDQELQDLPEEAKRLARLVARERRFARAYGRLGVPNWQTVQAGPETEKVFGQTDPLGETVFPTTSRGLTYRVPMIPDSPGYEEWQHRASERRQVSVNRALRSMTRDMLRALAPMKQLGEALRGFGQITAGSGTSGSAPVSPGEESQRVRPSGSDFPRAESSSGRASGRDNGAPNPPGEARFTREREPASHTVEPSDTGGE